MMFWGLMYGIIGITLIVGITILVYGIIFKLLGDAS